MGFGLCAICGQEMGAGLVVIAEVVDGDVKSHAHGQCWVDSGKTMMWAPYANPRESVSFQSGYWLDSIGALADVGLLRRPDETDHDYRNRLIERMRENAPQPAGD